MSFQVLTAKTALNPGIERAILLCGFGVCILCSSIEALGPPRGCADPPVVVRTSDEDHKAAYLHAQGSVAIAIDEEGDVVAARTIRADSEETGDILLGIAKSMKFKARPGCGTFKTIINYTLQPQLQRKKTSDPGLKHR